MSTELKKRVSAFLWHAGMMVLAFAVDQVLADLHMLHLPETVQIAMISFNPTVVLGLVLGQVSKYVHNKVKAVDDSQG